MVDGRFLVSFVLEGGGNSAHTLELPYTVLMNRVVGFGGTEHWKTQKGQKTSNFNKGGREHW